MNECDIFMDALQKAAPADRQAYLNEACRHDQLLRQRVEALLAVHERAGGFLKSPVAACDLVIDSPIYEQPGTVIGTYKLLEQIGEGGFGAVFMAEQLEPVRRTVALKLIKPGMDSRQVVARFEAERQALAMMDHPNIAKVLGAGATDAGRPYFVMELVRGIPITDYCDQAGFTVRVRLQLFVQVCRAVQHAHTKGVIHRDLKPGNVLVTSHDGVPVPYVIDFGVAKALGQQLSERSVHTGFAQMIGTPLYMSPEQAELNELGVDTRSDIYSLGVLLYELLTGATPFDKERLRTVAFDEMRRILREEEPPRPSTRLSTLGAALSTVSERRGVDPRKLTQTLQGELDWIVMKALEKDRNRRYETASAFAADVERYLNDESVEACPPTALYRLRKFARRHTAALSIAVLSCAALAVLVGSGIYYGIQQNRQERQRIATEQAVGSDLKEATFWREKEQWDKAHQALERAKGRLEGSGPSELHDLVEKSRREAALVVRLEEAQLQVSNLPVNELRDYAAADRAYEEAFKEYGLQAASLSAEEIAAGMRTSAIRSRLVTGLDYWAYVKGRLPNGDAEPLRAIARLADGDAWRQRLRDPNSVMDRKVLESLAEGTDALAQPPAYLLILGKLLDETNARAAAVRLLRRARERYPADFWLNYELAMLLRYDRRAAVEAVGLYRVAIALQPQSPIGYSGLADVLGYKENNWPEAIAAVRKSIELNPNSAATYDSLGTCLYSQQRLAAAEAAFRTAIELKPDYAMPYHNLGCVLYLQDRLSEALEASQRAVKLKPDFPNAFNTLGVILRALRNLPEAEAAQRRAIELDEAVAEANMGYLLMAQGKFADALTAFRRAQEIGQGTKSMIFPGAPYDFTSYVPWPERWLVLDAKLPSVVRGDTLPADNAERLALAEFSQLRCRQFFAASARLYSEAFAAEPGLVDDARTGIRYRAACAAAQAGCGQGKDAAELDANERTRLRGQAIHWLRADLATWQAELRIDPVKVSTGVLYEMSQWQRDTAFEGVHGDKALAKLPETERPQWQKLWEEVAQLERRAEEKR